MIRSVIFDLGGVIVPLDFERGYETIAPLCGLPRDQIPARIGSSELVPLFETGRIGSGEFVEGLSTVLGIEIGYEEFCRLWSSIFLPFTLIPESFVTELKRSYRVLLLSNTNPIHFEMIRENYPILRHFERCVLSYEVGAMKPSPAIYAEAVRQAGCSPAECFFTDDIEAYVEGARAFGIDAEQFVGYDTLVEHLKLRKLLC
ncbi:MAG: HAD family hydrolase [Bryobacteraceae bacterium]